MNDVGILRKLKLTPDLVKGMFDYSNRLDRLNYFLNDSNLLIHSWGIP